MVDSMDDVSSPTERCAFVLHVMVALLSVVYTAWVLLALFGGMEDTTAPPPSVLTHIIPTVAVGLFFAAPLLYALQNASIVASANSMESLHDSVTMKQSAPSLQCTDNSNNPGRPDNGDNCSMTPPMDAKKSGQGLPEIVDLDVGMINDLCWTSMQMS